MVGLSGGGGDWFWGESQIGGLTSGGRGRGRGGAPQLTKFSLSLSWHYWEEQPEPAVWHLLYRVHTVILHLGGVQKLTPGKWLGFVPLCRFPWIVVCISGSGCGFQMLTSSLRSCGIDQDNRRGLENFNFNNLPQMISLQVTTTPLPHQYCCK